MSEPVSSPTDRSTQADQIKKRIVEAASRLYAQKGLGNTSVEEIAREAGIHPSVTYQFVKNESSIMKMIMEDMLYELQEEMRPHLAAIDDPKEKLSRAMDLYFRIVSRERNKTLLVYQESKSLEREARSHIMSLEAETVQIFRDIIDEGIRRKAFVEGNSDLMAYNIIMLSLIWVLKGWYFRSRLDFEEYLEQEKQFLLRAICAGK